MQKLPLESTPNNYMQSIIKPFMRRLATLALVFSSFSAQAIVNLGRDIELEGFFEAKNILRTPSFEDAELIMQRNIGQVEGKYYFLRDSTAFGKCRYRPLGRSNLECYRSRFLRFRLRHSR